MDRKFEQIYYSDDGCWKDKSAIQKLAKASGLTKEEAEKWLLKQPLYQIYLPAPSTFLDQMQVCHYLLNQMISIRVISLVYPMTSSKRKHTNML